MAYVWPNIIYVHKLLYGLNNKIHMTERTYRIYEAVNKKSMFRIKEILGSDHQKLFYIYYFIVLLHFSNFFFFSKSCK